MKRKIRPNLLNRLNLNYDNSEEEVTPLINDNSNHNYEDIEIDKMIPSEENKSIYLTIEDEPFFEGLKQSILELGLIDPIVCEKVNDNYIIVSGHRRHTALMALYKEGHDQFKMTKARIIRCETKAKQLQTMLDANNTSREISDYSKMMSVRKYSEIYQIRKKNKQLSVGITEKEFVAKKMGMGPTQVAKYLFIHHHIDSALLEEVLKGDHISLNKLYLKMQDIKKNHDDLNNELSKVKSGIKKPVDTASERIIETRLSSKTKNKVKRFSKDLSKVYDTGKGLLLTNDLDDKAKKQVNNLLNRMDVILKELHPMIEDDDSVEL